MEGNRMIEETIKKRIKEIFEKGKVEISRIILFGSRARGDWRKDSDWDILIVVNKELTRDEKIEFSHLIRKKLAEELIPCDVLIKSEKEVEERKKVIGSIIRTAIKEGIVL